MSADFPPGLARTDAVPYVGFRDDFAEPDVRDTDRQRTGAPGASRAYRKVPGNLATELMLRHV